MEHGLSEAEAGMVKERTQQPCLSPLSGDGLIDVGPQVIAIDRDEIGQVRVLSVIPDLLVWIEIRRVRREPFHVDRCGMTLQVAVQDFGTVGL